jgi:hypothetical protein
MAGGGRAKHGLDGWGGGQLTMLATSAIATAMRDLATRLADLAEQALRDELQPKPEP